MPPHGGHHHGGGHHGGGGRRGGFGPGWGWGYPDYPLVEVVELDPDCYELPGGSIVCPTPVATGDFSVWDVVFPPINFPGILTGSPLDALLSAGCGDKSDAKLKGFDGRIQLIKYGYVPPAMFTWDQVNTVVGQLLAMSKTVNSAIENANREFSVPALYDAQVKILNTIGAHANELIAAKQPVDGLDMKNWVIDSLIAASEGLKVMYTSVCSRPWWWGALTSFQSAFDVIWNFLATLGSGIKKVVEYWTYVKWGAAAVIAYAVYNEYGKRKKSSRRRR